MKPSISDLYILNGNITLFLGTHSDQFKKDILHSSLLGQLLADNKPDIWLSTYTNALNKAYWAMNSVKTSIHKNKPSSLLDIFTTALTGTLQTEQLLKLIESLSTITQIHNDTPEYKALTRRLQPEKDLIDDQPPTFTLNTLVTVISETKTISSLEVLLKTTQALDITFLEHPISEHLIVGDIETKLWTSNLLEDKYVTIRDRVLSKLGSMCQTRLLHIKT